MDTWINNYLSIAFNFAEGFSSMIRSNAGQLLILAVV